jgi:hypothetical protein
MENCICSQREGMQVVPASNAEVSLWRGSRVFLQLHWIGQYGTKRANPHLENPNLQEVFL